LEIIDTAIKLSQVGSTALLLLALVGAYRGWWVPGRTYDESVKREAAWREMYEREKAARELDRDKERERATRP
jgi:hypothetical protein